MIRQVLLQVHPPGLLRDTFREVPNGEISSDGAGGCVGGWCYGALEHRGCRAGSSLCRPYNVYGASR